MDNKNNIEILQFSKYIPIDIKPFIGRKWILNGEQNSIFKTIKDSYDDSATNAAIIDAYSDYIYGDGMVDINFYKYMSKSDLRLACLDYKKFGGFTLQIIWNDVKNPADKKPLSVKYTPIYKIGINVDQRKIVNGYWYSYDWTATGQNKPLFFPKFDGMYKGSDIEIIMIQRPSSNPFFSQPDWLPGIKYAQLEGELSNASLNHVKNGFQGTKVINCNNGIPESEELKELYKRKIINSLTGTDNCNQVIVSFNENADSGIVVQDIPVTELNQQYVHFSEECERKLIVAHSAPPILFSGSRDGGGLGNNAEEIKTATQMLFRKKIYPYREVITDGLKDIFKYIDDTVIIEFKDFDDLNTNNTQ